MICSVQTPRSVQLESLYPQGVPGLWCKLLTHCNAQGQIDLPRMQAQLAFLRPHVQGFVLLDDDTAPLQLDRVERLKLIEWALQTLRPRKEFLLVAGNVSDASHDAQLIIPTDHSLAGLLVRPVLPETATQADLIDQLTPALRAGIAIALQQSDASQAPAYAGQTLATLAARHENLLYFADATGQDAIARSNLLPAGVFRFRSAEGHYTQALASTGGLYHGLMLASANVFPAQLAQLILDPALGQWDDSRTMSARLTAAMDSAQFLAQGLPRAIRAIDHLMAHGGDALAAPLPVFPDGGTLRHELLHAMTQVLAEHQLLPEKGYLS